MQLVKLRSMTGLTTGGADRSVDMQIQSADINQWLSVKVEINLVHVNPAKTTEIYKTQCMNAGLKVTHQKRVYVFFCLCVYKDL